jgi:ABC-type antimicrobial peptide transport system permease subunit
MIGGIVVSIASVLAVVSVAEGARSEVARQIASLGANLLLVQPGSQREQGVRHEAGSGSSLSGRSASGPSSTAAAPASWHDAANQPPRLAAQSLHSLTLWSNGAALSNAPARNAITSS